MFFAFVVLLFSCHFRPFPKAIFWVKFYFILRPPLSKTVRVSRKWFDQFSRHFRPVLEEIFLGQIPLPLKEVEDVGLGVGVGVSVSDKCLHQGVKRLTGGGDEGDEGDGGVQRRRRRRRRRRRIRKRCHHSGTNDKQGKIGLLSQLTIEGWDEQLADLKKVMRKRMDWKEKITCHLAWRCQSTWRVSMCARAPLVDIWMEGEFKTFPLLL